MFGRIDKARKILTAEIGTDFGIDGNCMQRIGTWRLDLLRSQSFLSFMA